MPLVHHFARSYLRRGFSREALEQEGVVGLLTAIDRFDLARENFASVASWCVRAALQRAVRGERVVQIPNRAAMLVAAGRRASCAIAHATGREPTTAEVASHAGWSPQARDLYLRTEAAMRCVARGAAEAEGSPLPSALDELPDRPAPGDADVRIRVEAALLRMRYGLEPHDRPMSYRAIAAAVGLSRQGAMNWTRRAFVQVAAHLGRPLLYRSKVRP